MRLELRILFSAEGKGALSPSVSYLCSSYVHDDGPSQLLQCANKFVAGIELLGAQSREALERLEAAGAVFEAATASAHNMIR